MSPHGPLWRVDLRSFGYTGPVQQHEEWGFPFESNPICFTTSDILVATFITRERAVTLGHRGSLTVSPLKVHAILLDAAAGTPRARAEWPTIGPRGAVIAVGGDGEFAVLTPGYVGLYSGGLRLLKRLALSEERQDHLVSFYSSPTGRSILAFYNNCMPHCSSRPPPPGEPQSADASYEWIATDSMQSRRIFKRFMPGVSISDSGVTYSEELYLKGRGFEHCVLIWSGDGPWRTFCRVRLGYNSDDDCGYPKFVSDSVLALWLPHELSLVPATGGSALLRMRFGENEWIGPRGVRPSANGKRLAVAVTVHKGGSALLDIDYHAVLKRIMVFDIPSRQWIYTLDAKKQKIKTISGLALSPDGSLMAIMSNGVVEVYRLPPSPPGQEPAPQP